MNDFIDLNAIVESKCTPESKMDLRDILKSDKLPRKAILNCSLGSYRTLVMFPNLNEIKSKGGLLLHAEGGEMYATRTAIFLKAGPSAFTGDHFKGFIPPKAGDLVSITQSVGNQFLDEDGNRYIIINDNHIHLVLHEKDMKQVQETNNYIIKICLKILNSLRLKFPLRLLSSQQCKHLN